MKLTNNTDFFQKESYSKLSENRTANKATVIQSNDSPEVKKVHKPRTSGAVAMLVKKTAETLYQCGLKAMARRVEKILEDTSNDRFVISVVGEFSRGKSTFLNNLLELDERTQLPTGNLPTTAVMTRIRYANQPKMAVFDEKGTRLAILDLTPESWENLVANNLGKEQPRGSVIVGVPNKWLGLNCIEMIDCPGAGDLSEERTKQIADTLDRTDAAIINFDAQRLFSMTEKEFILQRILKRKTPFSLIVINKLDLVPKEQRNGIVQFVKNKLELNKMNIPVYIPADIEMPDSTYDNIKGLDKIKATIKSWANDPKRQVLTDEWIKTRVLDIVFMAIDTLKEQQKLYEIDNDKYIEVIQNKKNALDKLKILWDELENNFLNRANECHKALLKKVEDYKRDIIDRLRFEAGKSALPKGWWNEDYPYRLKVELANMSIGIDNTISRIIMTDARWFNQMLDQRFKTYVQIEDTSVANKDDFTAIKSTKKVEFENLSRMQNIARLGTTALCIGSYFTPLGFMGSMGFGAVGGILTTNFFKAKIEEQREMLKKNIATDIPIIIDKAIEKSEEKIISLYNLILKDSAKKKELWREAQSLAIESEKNPKSNENLELVRTHLTALENILEKLN